MAPKQGAAALLLAATIMVAPPIAYAQTGEQANDQAAPQATQFSEDTLHAFAGAWFQVLEVANKYRLDVGVAADAGDKAEIDRLSELARAEMAAVVEAHPGISVEEYQRVIATANADSAFAARLRGILHVEEQKK